MEYIFVRKLRRPNDDNEVRGILYHKVLCGSHLDNRRCMFPDRKYYKPGRCAFNFGLKFS